uniref:Uncharacterized protein n=1 Tax=Romanomermis culicivorax TaxID=13658 RepID=A0A915HXU8_ROMCU
MKKSGEINGKHLVKAVANNHGLNDIFLIYGLTSNLLGELLFALKSRYYGEVLTKKATVGRSYTNEQ